MDAETVLKRSDFRLEIWDEDIAPWNDSIGSASFPLTRLFYRAYMKRKEYPRLILRKKNDFTTLFDPSFKATKRFYVGLTHSDYEGAQGYVKISVELLNSKFAHDFPAGKGRSDPNMNPYLPEPEGRFQCV